MELIGLRNLDHPVGSGNVVLSPLGNHLLHFGDIADFHVLPLEDCVELEVSGTAFPDGVVLLKLKALVSGPDPSKENVVVLLRVGQPEGVALDGVGGGVGDIVGVVSACKLIFDIVDCWCPHCGELQLPAGCRVYDVCLQRLCIGTFGHPSGKVIVLPCRNGELERLVQDGVGQGLPVKLSACCVQPDAVGMCTPDSLETDIVVGGERDDVVLHGPVAGILDPPAQEIIVIPYG